MPNILPWTRRPRRVKVWRKQPKFMVQSTLPDRLVARRAPTKTNQERIVIATKQRIKRTTKSDLSRTAVLRTVDLFLIAGPAWHQASAHNHCVEKNISRH